MSYLRRHWFYSHQVISTFPVHPDWMRIQICTSNLKSDILGDSLSILQAFSSYCGPSFLAVLHICAWNKISEPKTLVGVYCAYIIYVITPTYICAHMHTKHKILWDCYTTKFLRERVLYGGLSMDSLSIHLRAKKYPIIKASPFSTRNVLKSYVGIKKLVAGAR